MGGIAPTGDAVVTSRITHLVPTLCRAASSLRSTGLRQFGLWLAFFSGTSVLAYALPSLNVAPRLRLLIFCEALAIISSLCISIATRLATAVEPFRRDLARFPGSWLGGTFPVVAGCYTLVFLVTWWVENIALIVILGAIANVVTLTWSVDAAATGSFRRSLGRVVRIPTSPGGGSVICAVVLWLSSIFACRVGTIVGLQYAHPLLIPPLLVLSSAVVSTLLFPVFALELLSATRGSAARPPPVLDQTPIDATLPPPRVADLRSSGDGAPS